MREGEGRKERRETGEQMDTGLACAPDSRWLCVTQVKLIYTPGTHVTQHPVFNFT